MIGRICGLDGQVMLRIIDEIHDFDSVIGIESEDHLESYGDYDRDYYAEEWVLLHTYIIYTHRSSILDTITTIRVYVKKL